MYSLLLALDRTCRGSDLLLLARTILCLMSGFAAIVATTAFAKLSPFLIREFLECSSHSWRFVSETRLVV